jgi:Tfp pilus assembly protein PilF
MILARLRRFLALCAIFQVLFVLPALSVTGRAQTSRYRHQQQRTESDEKLLAEGLAALDRGDTAIAREFLERALAADPRNAQAHTYLGVIADRSGDLQEAERHFATAARLEPQSARAHNNYGAVLLRLNRPREAATEFEASLRLDPKQAKALVNLAQIRFDSGTAEGLRVADELFRRANLLAPDVEIARALTVIALRRNDPLRASDCYRSYAMRLTNVADKTLPAGERSDLGGALLEAGLLTEAEAELKAALSIEPANVDSLVRLARVFLARKDIPAAGRTLEGALARKVEAAPIYALLAVVYQKSGHIENAIPAMRRAIELDPQSERYRFQYGVLLIDADAPAAAEIRINEALQSFPKSARLWLALGLADLKMNKNNEAAQGFNRALEFEPDFAQTYAYLGIAQVMLGQYAEGTRFYEQALQKNPNIAVIHYLLADALLNQPDPDIPRIETHLKRAVQLDPTYALARMALGKLYARTEHLPEALAEFQRALEVDPNLAEAYYQLGRTYKRLKRNTEAETALATFKRLSDSQKQQQQDELREVVRRLADVLF